MPGAAPQKTGVIQPVRVYNNISGFKIGCGVAALFIVILGFVGGIFGFVIYAIKNSDAHKLALDVLKTSPEVREAIGEVESTGWPMGSLKTSGGGSGFASFSESVKGDKGKGKYYATLVKENDVWVFKSGRLEYGPGKSVNVTLGARGTKPVLPAPPAAPHTQYPRSGGKQLNLAGPTTDWRTIEWPEENIIFKVPGDWAQKELKRNSVEFDPADHSAFFVGNVTYFDTKIPFQTLWDSFLERGSGQLGRGEILGYQLLNLGRAEGYLEIHRRGDAAFTEASWTGYVDGPDFKTKSVTLLIGSPTPQDFERWEAVLGAIVHSVQIR